MRSLALNSFNYQRTQLLVKHYIKYTNNNKAHNNNNNNNNENPMKIVLTPDEIRHYEYIYYWDNSPINIEFGARLSNIIKTKNQLKQLIQIQTIYNNYNYLIHFYPINNSIIIYYSYKSNEYDQLQSLFHCFLYQQELLLFLKNNKNNINTNIIINSNKLQEINYNIAKQVGNEYNNWYNNIKNYGWKIDDIAIKIQSWKYELNKD